LLLLSCFYLIFLLYYLIFCLLFFSFLLLIFYESYWDARWLVNVLPVNSCEFCSFDFFRNFTFLVSVSILISIRSEGTTISDWLKSVISSTWLDDFELDSDWFSDCSISSSSSILFWRSLKSSFRPKIIFIFLIIYFCLFYFFHFLISDFYSYFKINFSFVYLLFPVYLFFNFSIFLNFIPFFLIHFPF